MKVFMRCAAVCAAAAVTLTGCSGKDLLTYESHRPIAVPEQISYSWWGNEARNEYTIEGIKDFEEQNTDIKVNTFSGSYMGYKENLDTLMRSGIEYDVMQIDHKWLDEYSADGEGFYDLYEIGGKLNFNNFDDEVLESGVRNGKLNGIPVSLDALCFCYNYDIFDQRKIEKPRNWNDLLRCGEKLSKDGISVLSADEDAIWIMLCAYAEQISGKQAFASEDSDECFGADEVTAMMQYAQKMFDNGSVKKTSSMPDAFSKGRSAGQMTFISDISDSIKPLEAAGMHIIMGRNPEAPSAKRWGWYVRPTGFYAISKNTENIDDAAKLLDYLLNDPGMAALQGMEKGLPASKSALETLEAKDQLSGLIYDADKQSKLGGDVHIMDSRMYEEDRYSEFFRLVELVRRGDIEASEAAEQFVSEYPFG